MAFVIDVFARRIVGWRVSTSMRTDFVLDVVLISDAGVFSTISLDRRCCSLDGNDFSTFQAREARLQRRQAA